jgi:uncharacterized protein YbaP (TraB family)
MRKLFLLTLGFVAQCLNLTSAWAQTSSNNSLLWKVSGKNLNKPSYIFGTIHAICKEDYFFTPKMQEALESSKKLVLEVDLSDPNATTSLQSHLMLPEGQQLRDYFDHEEEYQLFAAQVKTQHDIDIEFFSRFKPFMLISMLTMKSQSCATESYEMSLMKLASQKNIEVDGLESSLSQLEIFDRMPKQDIKNMLISTVQATDSTTNEFTNMIHFYKDQNVEALYKLITSSPDIAGHEAELISGRNIKWMNKLLFEMKDQTCFVAVGAGHLGGKKGLLQLLRNEGYTLEAVK